MGQRCGNHYERKRRGKTRLWIHNKSLHTYVLEMDSNLHIGLLNLNGYKEHSTVDILEEIKARNLNIVCLIKTMLRKEDHMKIRLTGWEGFEAWREDYSWG